MKVYQIGGYDENYNYLNNTYVYDPATTTWTRLADMPTARGDHMCVNFLGEVYSLGGYYVSKHHIYCSRVLYSSEIQVIHHSWLNSPCNRCRYVVDVQNDVTNPSDENSFSSKMESFNPVTGAWTTRPDLLTPRGDAVSPL
jgi:N-acetylneuraminic acid mutarotase